MNKQTKNAQAHTSTLVFSGAQESVSLFDSSIKKQTNKNWVCLIVLLGTFKYLRKIRLYIEYIYILDR